MQHHNQIVKRLRFVCNYGANHGIKLQSFFFFFLFSFDSNLILASRHFIRKFYMKIYKCTILLCDPVSPIAAVFFFSLLWFSWWPPFVHSWSNAHAPCATRYVLISGLKKKQNWIERTEWIGMEGIRYVYLPVCILLIVISKQSTSMPSSQCHGHIRLHVFYAKNK